MKTMPMFEPVLFVKWGGGPDEATPRYEEIAAGGLQARPPDRSRAAALPLRLDAQGGFHLHSPEDGAILAFGPDGCFAGRTPLSPRAVTDFAAGVDRYHCVFRERTGGGLVSVDRAGAVAWRREDLDRSVDRVVLTPRGLFACARSAPERLVHLDPSTGATVRELELEHEAIRPFAAPDGALVAATYFPEARRRGVLVLDPETGKEAARVGDKELYGTLLSIFGTDAEHNVYLYGATLGDRSPSLFVVGADAQVRLRAPFDALLASGSGRRAVMARFTGSDLHLTWSGEGGQTVQVAWPERLRARVPEGVALVEADEERAIFDLRGEGGPTERVALRLATGALEPVSAAGAVVHGMQPVTTWQVGADGRVHVPVTSEEGVSVVRLELR